MQNVSENDLTSNEVDWLCNTMQALPAEYKSEYIAYRYLGVLYLVRYRKDLSCKSYTKTKVYDVLTMEENWSKCQTGIMHCVGDDSISIGSYKALNHAHPSVANHLKKHHKMENVSDTDVMRYTIIEPYDD